MAIAFIKFVGPNDTSYLNPEMDRLYDQMSTLQPGTKRAKLIAAMDDILQKDAPWVLLYYHNQFRLSQGWLKNFRGGEMILNGYKYYRIDEKERKRLLSGS